MHRVNVGCGMTPTQGWINFDNSTSVKLARYPAVSSLLHLVGLLGSAQLDYIRFCQTSQIRWANATASIPLPDHSVEVLYSSHMLEHLDRDDALQFLREVQRVLAPGGTLRLAVPDLKKQVQAYCDTQDADQFIEAAFVCIPRPRTWSQRLKSLLVGPRHHQWMYDGASLARLLTRAGFSDAKVMPAGETRIVDPGALNLRERAAESVYVEAVPSHLSS